MLEMKRPHLEPLRTMLISIHYCHQHPLKTRILFNVFLFSTVSLAPSIPVPHVFPPVSSDGAASGSRCRPVHFGKPSLHQKHELHQSAPVLRPLNRSAAATKSFWGGRQCRHALNRPLLVRRRHSVFRLGGFQLSLRAGNSNAGVTCSCLIDPWHRPRVTSQLPS